MNERFNEDPDSDIYNTADKLLNIGGKAAEIFGGKKKAKAAPVVKPVAQADMSWVKWAAIAVGIVLAFAVGISLITRKGS